MADWICGMRATLRRILQRLGSPPSWTTSPARLVTVKWIWVSWKLTKFIGQFHFPLSTGTLIADICYEFGCSCLTSDLLGCTMSWNDGHLMITDCGIKDERLRIYFFICLFYDLNVAAGWGVLLFCADCRADKYVSNGVLRVHGIWWPSQLLFGLEALKTNCACSSICCKRTHKSDENIMLHGC